MGTKRNIEMIRLLLIHGADLSRCAVMSECDFSGENERETALTAFDILEREPVTASRDDIELRKEISTILKSKVRWFPELIDFYPRRMRECLSIIVDTLSDE